MNASPPSWFWESHIQHAHTHAHTHTHTHTARPHARSILHRTVTPAQSLQLTVLGFLGFVVFPAEESSKAFHSPRRLALVAGHLATQGRRRDEKGPSPHERKQLYNSGSNAQKVVVLDDLSRGSIFSQRCSFGVMPARRSKQFVVLCKLLGRPCMRSHEDSQQSETVQHVVDFC